MRQGASELAGQAEAGAARIFAGSSDGASYAADTPVLGSFFGPASAPARQRGGTVGFRDASPISPSMSASAPAAVETRRSLAELTRLPASKLKQMLAQRGVGPGTAADKDGLAEWVFQHQDLPVVRQVSKEVGAQARETGTSKAVAELGKMSVAELRSMLDERGVSSIGKTEKAELIEWVFQHQHLPAVQRKTSRGHDRKNTSQTKCKQSRTRDRLRGDEVVTTAEAPDADDEVEAARLLTEGSPPEPEPSMVWKVVGAAAAVTAVGLVGAGLVIGRRNNRCRCDDQRPLR